MTTLEVPDQEPNGLGTSSSADFPTAPAAPCRRAGVFIRLPKDDGAIFDNAMTELESKRPDRTRGILSALRSREAELACCFSPPAMPRERTEGLTLLRLTLEANGELRAATILVERSSIHSEAIAACLTRVLHDTAFPTSPAGRETTVEYPIHVRHGG